MRKLKFKERIILFVILLIVKVMIAVAIELDKTNHRDLDYYDKLTQEDILWVEERLKDFNVTLYQVDKDNNINIK
jgi:hypothetical protein